MIASTFTVATTTKSFLQLLAPIYLDPLESLDGCLVDVVEVTPALTTVFIADPRHNTSLELLITQAASGHIAIQLTADPSSALLTEFKAFIGQYYGVPLPVDFLSDDEIDSAALALLSAEDAPEATPTLSAGRPSDRLYDMAFAELYQEKRYKTRRAAFDALILPTLGNASAGQRAAAFMAFESAMDRRRKLAS